MQSLQERIDATIKAAECIDRAIMPQVDEKDIPELLDHLAAIGISHEQRWMVDPKTLKGYQRIVPAKVRGIARTNRVLFSKSRFCYLATASSSTATTAPPPPE